MRENMILPEALYTSKGLADALGMSERVIRDKANKGELKGHKAFGKWFFKGSDIISLITGESGIDLN